MSDNPKHSPSNNSDKSVGSWIKKHRYQDEDYPFSPPDDLGFLPLKFGYSDTVVHDSMYDRINKQLGISIESPKFPKHKDSLVKDASPAPSISFGIHKITLPTKHPVVKEEKEIIALVPGKRAEEAKIIIPPAIRERKESDVKQEYAETLIAKAHLGRHTTVEDTSCISESSGNVLDMEGNNKTTQSAFVEAATAAAGFMNQSQNTPMPSMSLNPNVSEKASNFFFTGGLFSSISSTTASTSTSSELPSSASVPNFQVAPVNPIQVHSTPCSPRKVRIALLGEASQQMEDSADAAALNFSPKLSKRRPKPSALREMNFLAPQSM